MKLSPPRQPRGPSRLAPSCVGVEAVVSTAAVQDAHAPAALNDPVGATSGVVSCGHHSPHERGLYRHDGHAIFFAHLREGPRDDVYDAFVASLCCCVCLRHFSHRLNIGHETI